MKHGDLWDVAIVGAGPAGSAAAAFLASAGHRVIVLERERFPRFHIGESLLPLGVLALQHLGIDLSEADYALRKSGAIVLCESTGSSHRISFRDTLPGLPDHAYQVVRSDFDHALAVHAQELGATMRFGEQVRSCTERSDDVLLEGTTGSVRARYAIDATGLTGLLARSRRERCRLVGLGKCASFAHYTSVQKGALHESFPGGEIALLLVPDAGWAWAIPLPGDRVSVGLVHPEGQPHGTPEHELRTLVEESPFLQRLLEDATPPSNVHRCTDYSYVNRVSTTDRTVCLADAHSFLDPVFSTGVSLALHSAHLLSQAMAPPVGADESLRLEKYFEAVGHGYRVFEKLLERFYRPGWAHTTFFHEPKPRGMMIELNTILAGDVWRTDNAWQNQLLASRRGSLRRVQLGN